MKTKPLFILLAILGIALFLAIKGCKDHKDSLDASNSYAMVAEQRFLEFKTKSDLNAARAEQTVFNLQTLLAAKRAEIAKLTKELKLKPKRIKEIVEVVIDGKDSVVLKLDTLYYQSTDEPASVIPYTYEDKWNSFQAFLDGDQIGLLYAVTDSISIVKTREKDGTRITALSSNPAIRITGLSSVMVQDKKIGRFGIGPTLGVGYNGKFVVVPGIGIQYSLIRF